MLLGEGHPLDPTSNVGDEIVNNVRALTYAQSLGLGWLSDCLDCDSASEYALAKVLYATPKTDPAPWYNNRFPDSAGFCGVYGIDITGAEDATLDIGVTNTLSPGGVLGTTYIRPREMIVRAIAVADSECALQEGFNWFKQRAAERAAECRGDTLTFFYCCPPMDCRADDPRDPCPCDDMETPGGPCWVDTYLQLRSGPDECTPTWWPTTYGELKSGPPTDDEWCHWVYVYYELTLGADEWTCGAEACVVPYLWQFYDCAIVEGPSVLSHRTLSRGAFMELEFTIVAADPVPHRLKGHPSVWDPEVDEPLFPAEDLYPSNLLFPRG
jgi:hypothetical protein